MTDPPPTSRARRATSDVAVVIPSVGAPALGPCLAAVAELEPPPLAVIVVHSGPARPPSRPGVQVLRSERTLGFAAAVNAGIAAAPAAATLLAILNDDALTPPGWLAALGGALAADRRLAAVQGTITDLAGERIDGRGITLDRWALPVQVDRGAALQRECPGANEPRLAVSGTACLLRRRALAEIAIGRLAPFDPTFGSYHEDLDLGLRLRRLGWRAAWVGGAPVRHAGSASGLARRWRHPWWLLANRWRAFAGNLSPSVFLAELPRLLRGEIRAVRTLARSNRRAPVAGLAVGLALPVLAARGWRRPTPGARLDRLPERP